MSDRSSDPAELEAGLRLVDEREQDLRATLRSLRISGFALGAMSVTGLVSWVVDPRLWGLSAAVVVSGIIGLGLALGLWRFRLVPRFAELARERERLIADHNQAAEDPALEGPDAV